MGGDTTQKGSTDPLDLQKRFGRKKTDLFQPTVKLGLTGASDPAKRKVRLLRLPRRTPNRERADAYITIGQLRSEKCNIDIPVSAYVPAPADSLRGAVYKAYTDKTGQAIQSELANKNRQLPIVDVRRLGSSKHLVITFAGKDLTRLVRYRCFTLNLYPYTERPEACFNRRKLGHRADVCPLPRPPRCPQMPEM
ncbi:hypothetical protein HPB52_001958 [Rhipicephalus sanguineus]|uniref:Uncharacterized protein n=1 Tax=Rhipicephalus sanguineus TaxID=34632 RepID=A0A9D4SVH9_RHISA|nr:hypothetical protein HPB52_001958 [Rhipicephalus sanguineus]